VILNNKEIPTKIRYIVDYEGGSKEVVLDPKTLSEDELIMYASSGQKAALYELRARIAQNSPEDNTDKI
jgi:hypothetical protein